MTRLVLRLQRFELAALVLVFAILAAMLASTRGFLAETIGFFTTGTCPVPMLQNGSCQLDPPFLYTILQSGQTLLIMLPLFAGALLALPLVSDLDSGTYRLAWTQSLSRRHWLGRHLGVAFAAIAVSMSLLPALYRWWLAPMPQPDAADFITWFELKGVVSYGWALLAFGLVLAVGVVTRRTIVALIVGGLLAFTVFAPWINFGRPHLVAPIVRDNSVPYTQGDYGIGSYILDRNGQEISSETYWNLCAPDGNPALVTLEMTDACEAANGLTFINQVHPWSHYWPMQLRELALVGLVGLGLTGLASWRILSRWE